MSLPVNLFVDAHTFDSEFQGSRTFIKEIYNRFPTDDNFKLFFAANNLENLRNEIKERSNVFYIQYKSRSSVKRLSVELPLLLRKLKIDYAHFQYITPPIKVCKYIVTTHDVIFEDYPEEFSRFYRLEKHIPYKIAAKQADILTTVSKFSKQSIHRFLNIDLQKIHVIPNAVGDKYFLSYNKDEMKQYIFKKYNIANFVLVVSRIEPRKNHAVVLKAFKDLDLFKRGYHLVFIGTQSISDESIRNEMKTLTAKELAQYHHLENIDEEDLIRFYNAATLCIYPSKAEGFGIPPLESAALKIPTLCSNVSAMSDFSFFEDAHFNPKDQTLLENKILNVLNNKVPEESLAKISDAIKKKYSWCNSANLFFNLILRHSKS